MTLHGILIAPLLNEFRVVLTVISKEIHFRTVVRSLAKSDDGIKQNGEVGTHFPVGMGAHRRG